MTGLPCDSENARWRSRPNPDLDSILARCHPAPARYSRRQRAYAPIAVALDRPSASAPQEYPIQVFSLPVVLSPSAKTPTAVFLMPVVLLPSARPPTAVLLSPEVFEYSASAPSAVLPLPDCCRGAYSHWLKWFGIAPMM
jgi:hypothetical protein